jgi:hypothetical protein
MMVYLPLHCSPPCYLQVAVQKLYIAIESFMHNFRNFTYIYNELWTQKYWTMLSAWENGR